MSKEESSIHLELSITADAKVMNSKKQKRNKRKCSSKTCTKDIDAVPQKKHRPNYFFGIRLNKPEILGRIKAVQQLICSANPQFSKAVVPISTSHLTVGLLHLTNEESVSQVCSILKEQQSNITNLIGSGIDISLNEIGEFNHQVVYAKVYPGKNLIKLFELSELLEKSCIEFCSQPKAFKPHVTIMKLSKLSGPYKKKPKKIPGYLYRSLSKIHFGTQPVHSIELLSMLKRKQTDGYYHSEYMLTLDNGIKSSDVTTVPLRDWADCIAVSCITLALYTSASGHLDHFSDHLACVTIKDALKKTKGTFSNEAHRKDKEAKLKKIINSEEVVTEGHQESGIA